VVATRRHRDTDYCQDRNSPRQHRTPISAVERSPLRTDSIVRIAHGRQTESPLGQRFLAFTGCRAVSVLMREPGNTRTMSLELGNVRYFQVTPVHLPKRAILFAAPRISAPVPCPSAI